MPYKLRWFEEGNIKKLLSLNWSTHFDFSFLQELYICELYLIYFIFFIYWGWKVFLILGLFPSSRNQEITQSFTPCLSLLLIFPQELERRTYLCTSDYDEGYFDFHCLPEGKPVSDGMEWYTICGTPFPNRAEYISAIALVCTVASFVYFNLLVRSSPTLYHRKTVTKRKKLNWGQIETVNGICAFNMPIFYIKCWLWLGPLVY